MWQCQINHNPNKPSKVNAMTECPAVSVQSQVTQQQCQKALQVEKDWFQGTQEQIQARSWNFASSLQENEHKWRQAKGRAAFLKLTWLVWNWHTYFQDRKIPPLHWSLVKKIVWVEMVYKHAWTCTKLHELLESLWTVHAGWPVMSFCLWPQTGKNLSWTLVSEPVLARPYLRLRYFLTLQRTA